MSRPDDVEVPAVEGCDGRSLKTLRRGYDGGVHRSERQVPVPGDELGDAQPVTGLHRLRDEGAESEIAQEADLRVGPQTACNQIGHFRDDQNGDEQGPWMRLQELEAGGVVPVVLVDVGVERPRVD